MSLLSTLNTYFAFWAVCRKMFKVQNTATMNTEYLEYTILIILFMLEQGRRSCNFITHSNIIFLLVNCEQTYLFKVSKAF